MSRRKPIQLNELTPDDVLRRVRDLAVIDTANPALLDRALPDCWHWFGDLRSEATAAALRTVAAELEATAAVLRRHAVTRRD